MSRRLKRKVRELCNLDSLSKEERRIVAKEILENTQAKQKLCNSMLGLTFKDIERTMKDILAEHEPTEEEELMEMAPEKFEPYVPPVQEKQRPYKRGSYRTLTMHEVQALIEASEQPPVSEPIESVSYKDYTTYSREEVAALINCDYDPTKFKKSRKSKRF